MKFNLFGVVDRKTTARVKAVLETPVEGDLLEVTIDSEGGSVFDGLSIYSNIQAFEGPKTAVIESAAFSIASYIAMAFDQVAIVKNGWMMIHNPSVAAEGGPDELQRQAELLTKLKAEMVSAYADKTGIPPETIERMMNEETFMNAEEALAAGFVDKIINRETSSQIEPNALHSMPFRVVASLRSDAPESGEPLPTEEQLPMADKTAATVRQIKARFPKASAEFIVKAMEEELAMEDIDAKMMEELTAQVEELKAENDKLHAQLEEYAAQTDEEPEAMEDEKDKPAAMENEDEEPEAMEEEEKKPAARRSGTAPVAKRRSASGYRNYTAEWNDKVQAQMARGISRPKAVKAVNKQNPGLRENMLAESAR